MSITWERDGPRHDATAQTPPTIEVAFTVRSADLFSMYLAPTGAKLTALPGLILAVVLLVGSSPTDLGNSNVGPLVVAGVLLAIACPVYVCLLGSFVYRSYRTIGLPVTLRLDQLDVQGWPVAPSFDRHWDRIHNAMRFAGVTVLPFGGASARQGWVPIQDRALSTESRARLDRLLQEQGLARPSVRANP